MPSSLLVRPSQPCHKAFSWLSSVVVPRGVSQLQPKMLSEKLIFFSPKNCFFTCYHVITCVFTSYHVLSCLIMSYHGFHMLSCDNMCFLMCFWLSSHHPLVSWLSSHPSLVLWLSSHHTTVVSNVSCGCPATIFSHPPSAHQVNLGGPPPQKKNHQEKDHQLQRSQILRLPSSKNFSKDPSVWIYLGVPSPKKIPEIPVFWYYLGGISLQKFPTRSQCLRLSWGSLPKKNPRDPSFWYYLGGTSLQKFPTRSQCLRLSWGSLTKKNPRDPSFWYYLGGTSSSKISHKIPVFEIILGVPPQKKFQRSQFLILPWGYFPPKISHKIPVFETILGVPPQKKSQRSQFLILPWGYFLSKNFPQDPSFSHYLGGPSPKQNPRDPSFWYYLGGSFQKKTRTGSISGIPLLKNGYPAIQKWLSSHPQMAIQPSNSFHFPVPIFPLPCFHPFFSPSIQLEEFHACLEAFGCPASNLAIHQVVQVDLLPVQGFQAPEQIQLPSSFPSGAALVHAATASPLSQGVACIDVRPVLAHLTFSEEVPPLCPELLPQSAITVAQAVILLGPLFPLLAAVPPRRAISSSSLQSSSASSISFTFCSSIPM